MRAATRLVRAARDAGRSLRAAAALVLAAGCDGATTGAPPRARGHIAFRVADAPAEVSPRPLGAPLAHSKQQQPLRPVASVVSEARLSAGAQTQAQPISCADRARASR
jgi:hypothetical protein